MVEGKEFSLPKKHSAHCLKILILHNVRVYVYFTVRTEDRGQNCPGLAVPLVYFSKSTKSFYNLPMIFGDKSTRRSGGEKKNDSMNSRILC